MSWYCDIAPGHPIHGPYHDEEYGFPTDDDSVLFERLSLEIFQAGLSWELVLKKRPMIFEAFTGFNIDTVATYDGADVDRLLGNPGIIRNRLKVVSIIENSRRLQRLRSEFGSFHHWLQSQNPQSLENWVKLFRAKFKFVGPEIVREFLVSTGYLIGAHRQDCPVYDRIMKQYPPWQGVHITERDENVARQV